VLLYQMGIAALLPLGFYFMIAMKAWRLYVASGLLTQGLAAFGILVVLVNGFFQEEALFAPPALGLLACLAGLVIGNAVRSRSDAQPPRLRSGTQAPPSRRSASEGVTSRTGRARSR
jgi:hypothetical protein